MYRNRRMKPRKKRLSKISKRHAALILGVTAFVVTNIVLGMSHHIAPVLADMTETESSVADLSAVWTVSESVPADGMIEQAIDLGNDGPAGVKEIRLTEPIPSGTEFAFVKTSDPVTRASCDILRHTTLECTVTPAGAGLVPTGHITVTLSFRVHGERGSLVCGSTIESGGLEVSPGQKRIVDPNPLNTRISPSKTLIDCEGNES